jgi:hypothetical protein
VRRREEEEGEKEQSDEAEGRGGDLLDSFVSAHEALHGECPSPSKATETKIEIAEFAAICLAILDLQRGRDGGGGNGRRRKH